MAGFPAYVEVLLAAGADPQAPDSDGNTPLHNTFLQAAAAALIRAGADPRVVNRRGEMPWQALRRVVDVSAAELMAKPEEVNDIERTIAYLRSLVEGDVLERDTVPVAMTQAEEAAKARGGRM